MIPDFTDPERAPRRLRCGLHARSTLADAASAQARQMQAMERFGPGTAARSSGENVTPRHQQASPRDPVAAGRHAFGLPHSGHSGSGNACAPAAEPTGATAMSPGANATSGARAAGPSAALIVGTTASRTECRRGCRPSRRRGSWRGRTWLRHRTSSASNSAVRRSARPAPTPPADPHVRRCALRQRAKRRACDRRSGRPERSRPPSPAKPFPGLARRVASSARS